MMRRTTIALNLHRYNNRKIQYLLVICFCSLFIYFLFALQKDEIVLGNGDVIDLSDYIPFEPVLAKDFPTIDSTLPRIPKIIHQTWKDVYVPMEFHANVRSFVEQNTDYQYYFWTDASARQLIMDKHPELLYTFDNYVEPVRKADMLRYVVLYEFGGIYADLDTLCLRPLDRVLNKFSCVISPEPYEHSSLIYNTKFMVTNSIMFCQQHHPFLQQLMDNLPSFSHFSQDIDSSGPNYVTLQLNMYIKKAGHKMTELHDHYVYIPSSQFFQNQIDSVRFNEFKRMCRQFSTLNTIARSGCVSLKRRGLVRRVGRYEFTRHSFYHTGYKWIPSSNVKISDLVERVVIYETD